MTDSVLINEIASLRNLYWAWEKAKWFYKPGDIWFDELEISSFEANIDYELSQIRKSLMDGSYSMVPIRPVAFPKKKDELGTRTRQTFWVSVRDQVTWLAVMNVLGEPLDIKMPFWSYGNRVYISTFYEENEQTNKSELKFGFYRNTSRYAFRKWTQSWPLYRRHICLTARFLSRTQKDRAIELDDKDFESIEINDKLDSNHPLKVDYITPNYWSNVKKDKLFWAGLDLEKFYPSVNNSSIVKNITKYVNRGDSKFIELITNLLDFKLDLSQWTEAELEKIQLPYGTNSYSHIPTGLFVGGFLANVALLEVDSLISKKLKENKKIAHFRYVDDHVILSSSFEELIEWIEDYEVLLKESGVLSGTVINPEKTEPKEVGDYFKAKKEGDLSKALDAFELARIESELDPEFPSPLMTQTLTKVSRIAGTEFQLLDPEEQKGLVADVEHLLVTEFPDNELRRDTRIAFAARMMTSLVPRIESSVLKQYELEKKSMSLQIKLRKEANKKESEQNSQLIKELNQKINLNKTRIDAEINENLKTEKKLISRTVKLLKKSVRENHQKVRLWTRLIEFCLKSGGQLETDVINELNRLIEIKESNKLSNTFIQSLIVQVLTNQLIKAYKIVTDESTLYKSRHRANQFIRSVLSHSLMDILRSNYDEDSKFYETDTFNAFKFASGTVIYLLDDHNDFRINNNWEGLIQRFQLVNWKEGLESFSRTTNYSVEEWVWWITEKINPRKAKPSILWFNSIEKINTSSSVGRTIILQFPQHLPYSVLIKVDQAFDNYKDFRDEGWLYEVYYGLLINGKKSNFHFLRGVQKKFQEYEKDITLDKWIEWTSVLPEESERYIAASFDPRRSEWMALELTKQIAITFQSKVLDIEIEDLFSETDAIDTYARAFHPKNFKIPKRILEDDSTTWHDLKSAVEKPIIAYVAKDHLIFDKRLNPMFLSYDYEGKIGSIINGLGAMLVLLLSRKVELPSKWNPLGHQTLWLEQMNLMLRNYPVSSYTRDIIAGCFSKRNIETQILLKKRAALSLLGEDDFKNDPPRFSSIQQFIEFIQLSQELLEKQQVSISDNQPRQLIPISLIQMKSENYQEK